MPADCLYLNAPGIHIKKFQRVFEFLLYHLNYRIVTQKCVGVIKLILFFNKHAIMPKCCIEVVQKSNTLYNQIQRCSHVGSATLNCGIDLSSL